MDALIAEVGKDRLGVRLSPFGGASQARPRAALSCCGAEPVRAWRAAVQAAAFACAVCLAVFWWLGSRRSSDADAALCKAQSHASRCACFAPGAAPVRPVQRRHPIRRV